MKTKEITNKTQADLLKLLADRRENLRVFRFGSIGAKAKNVREGRVIRKDVARILTVLNSKKV